MGPSPSKATRLDTDKLQQNLWKAFCTPSYCCEEDKKDACKWSFSCSHQSAVIIHRLRCVEFPPLPYQHRINLSWSKNIRGANRKYSGGTRNTNSWESTEFFFFKSGPPIQGGGGRKTPPLRFFGFFSKNLQANPTWNFLTFPKKFL